MPFGTTAFAPSFLRVTDSVTKWLDYFQYLAIYIDGNLPQNIKICQSNFRI